jgi:hypothetical protein
MEIEACPIVMLHKPEEFRLAFATPLVVRFGGVAICVIINT